MYLLNCDRRSKLSPCIRPRNKASSASASVKDERTSFLSTRGNSRDGQLHEALGPFPQKGVFSTVDIPYVPLVCVRLAPWLKFKIQKVVSSLSVVKSLRLHFSRG